MSNVFFIGDLHLDHKNILNFSPMRGGTNVEEHNEWIITQWNSVVRKNDKVWVCGDVCFSNESLKLLDRMAGYKNLVRGNHDKQSSFTYLKYFNHINGIIKVHGYWVTHAPIHPQELRGKKNIHGHVHSNSIRLESGELDDRYINVSVENIHGTPISLEQIKAKYG